MDRVCDDEFDCEDGSDEQSCKRIDFHSHYLKQIPRIDKGNSVSSLIQ